MKKRLHTILLAFAAVTMAGGTGHAQDAPSQAEARARMRDILQNDPALPAVAPAGHDVTIVVFSDYQCPYCRKLHPALESLLREDGKVRIVYRDWPIFGGPSTEAARAAIASRYQGKHAAFNDALMATRGKLASDGIRAAADSAGVDWKRLQADLVKHKAEIDGALARTDRIARAMGLSGTPVLVIGPYLVPGALSPENLRLAVEAARRPPAS